MRTATRLPILHIVDAAAHTLRKKGIGPGKVGIMGTAATLAMRLYQDRLETLGWSCLTPTEDEMQRLVSPAIARVKANQVSAAYADLAKAAAALVDRGVQAVVLGCTEIPLGMQAGPALPFPVVDTIDALAEASIAWAATGEEIRLG